MFRLLIILKKITRFSLNQSFKHNNKNCHILLKYSDLKLYVKDHSKILKIEKYYIQNLLVL